MTTQVDGREASARVRAHAGGSPLPTMQMRENTRPAPPASCDRPAAQAPEDSGNAWAAEAERPARYFFAKERM
jgi:hypothetical protein